MNAAATQVLSVAVDPPHVVDPQIKQDVGMSAYGDAERLDFPLLCDIGRNACLLYGTVEKVDERAKFRSFLVDKDRELGLLER